MRAPRVKWLAALALLALAPSSPFAEVKSSKPDGFLPEQRIIMGADAQGEAARQ